jgi:hypothetical protein
MKIMHLAIVTILSTGLVIPTLQTSNAIPDFSPIDLYNQSHAVFYGQVLAKQQGPGPNYYYYLIKVENYFKNPQGSNFISIAGHKPLGEHVPYPEFEVGDKAIFYVTDIDGIQTILPFSTKAGEGCDLHAFLGSAPIPGEPIVRGPPSPLDQVADANMKSRSPFTAKQQLAVSYHIWNDYPQSRQVTVDISVVNQNDSSVAYHYTQTNGVGACDTSTVSWIFAPTKVGNYEVSVLEDGKFRAGEDFQVQCNKGLTIIFKAEDDSPVCVKPDTANILIERGWAKEIVTNTSIESSTLNKTTTNELKIDLSNQTYEAGYPVYVNLKNINQESTCKIPSISVRNTSDQSLVFGPTPVRNYTGHCTDPWQITFYAGLEKNALITKSTRYSILATLDNKTYQKEFTVIPSQYSNKNITTDSTQIVPGYLTFTSCLPVSDVPNNGTLINYTGFDLYRRYLAGPDMGGIPEIDDYLLRPGHTGSFVMQIHQGQFSKDANLAGGLYFLSENLLNLDNSTVWNNRPLASEAHLGLVLSYTPSFAKAGPQGYVTITASISALQNAPRGTYWLYLLPGICGGDRVLLTIGDQPLAQPPDYIGYDLASNFAQGVGNPAESDITFELINAGIHSFENCSLNYISKNQTTTIKTFDVIPPGMEYRYHASVTPNSIDSGFLECKKPPITKIYPDTWIDILPY